MSLFLLSLLLVPTVFSDEIRARRRLADYDDCRIEVGTFLKVSGTYACRADLLVHGSLWVTANTTIYASSVTVSATGSMVLENGTVWTPSAAPPPATSPNQPPTTTTTPPPTPSASPTKNPTSREEGEGCSQSCEGLKFSDGPHEGEDVCAAEQCVNFGVGAVYVDLAYTDCTADLDVASEMFESGCCDIRTCDGSSIISDSPTPYVLSASPTVRDNDSDNEENDTDNDLVPADLECHSWCTNNDDYSEDVHRDWCERWECAGCDICTVGVPDPTPGPTLTPTNPPTNTPTRNPTRSPTSEPTPVDEGEGCSRSCVGLRFSDGYHEGQDVCGVEQCAKSDDPNAAVYVDLAYGLCRDLRVALNMFAHGCCDTRTCLD